jgi:hypothetical protein
MESGRQHEGDVVDARREPRVVGPAAVLATATVEGPHADGEEEVLVHARGELRLAQARRERGGRGRVVVRRQGGHGRAAAVAGAAVVEDGGGRGVVEGDTLGAGVGVCGEVVAPRRLAEGNQDVGGLARGRS